MRRVQRDEAVDLLREIVSFYWDVDSQPIEDARAFLARLRGDVYPVADPADDEEV